jgi:hypothetical protein
MVTTCDSGLAAAAEAGFALPRISDGDHVSQLEFEAEVSGFMELVRMALGFIRRWTARRSVVGELEPATPAV